MTVKRFHRIVVPIALSAVFLSGCSASPDSSFMNNGHDTRGDCPDQADASLSDSQLLSRTEFGKPQQSGDQTLEIAVLPVFTDVTSTKKIKDLTKTDSRKALIAVTTNKGSTKFSPDDLGDVGIRRTHRGAENRLKCDAAEIMTQRKYMGSIDDTTPDTDLVGPSSVTGICEVTSSTTFFPRDAVIYAHVAAFGNEVSGRAQATSNLDTGSSKGTDARKVLDHYYYLRR